MATVEQLKHLLKWQEFRQTLFLNASRKDAYGRHRGHVLYGMRVTPLADNVIQIGAGALYTPFGTSFYFEAVNLAAAQIDIDGVLVNDQPILSAFNFDYRPLAIAIVANVSVLSAEQNASIESPADIGTKISFIARPVSWSWETMQPTFNQLPYDPIKMLTAQSPANLYATHETFSNGDGVNPHPAVQPPPAQSADSSSIGTFEVIMGYILIGAGPGSGGAGVMSTMVSTVPGEWAAGIEYVPMMNVWDGIAAMLGVDPLMGIHGGDVTSVPDDAAAAEKQTYSTEVMKNGGIEYRSVPLIKSPRFGTTEPADNDTPWLVDWHNYRLPNFFRDGESFLWALRRLDYVLRLWMDRTGDQDLVRWTQDSTGVSLDRMAPLDQILLNFDGTDDAGTNLNTVDYDAASADNNTLKSGRLPHEKKDLNILSTGYGDTHRTALNAVNAALRHVLFDIFGFGGTGHAAVPREYLRAASAWSRTLVTGLRFDEAPIQANVLPTVLLGSVVFKYLVDEPVYQAIEHVAKRVQSPPGLNLLINPCFFAGLTGWTLSSVTSTEISRDDFHVVRDFTFDDGADLFTQAVTVSDTILEDMTAETAIISLSLTGKIAGGAASCYVMGYNGATPLFSVRVDMPVSGGAFKTWGTSFAPAAVVTGLNKLVITFTRKPGESATTTIQLAGVWLGFGMPPRHIGVQSLWFDFLSRDGGTMRGDLDYGTHHGHNLAMVTPTPAGTDAANVDYANGAASSAASTRVAKAGDSMSGDLTMTGGKEVLGLPAAPTGGDGAATSKKYVNDQDSARVAKTGDSMSGNLTMTGNKEVLGLPAAPIGGDGAATSKKYVDDQVYLAMRIVWPFPSSTTFTVPDGFTSVRVSLVGGGGGGGGGQRGDNGDGDDDWVGGGAGGGGGAGELTTIELTVPAIGPRTISVTIGTAGTAGLGATGSLSEPGQNGSAGGVTSITYNGITYRARGGYGGKGGGGVNTGIGGLGGDTYAGKGGNGTLTGSVATAGESSSGYLGTATGGAPGGAGNEEGGGGGAGASAKFGHNSYGVHGGNGGQGGAAEGGTGWYGTSGERGAGGGGGGGGGGDGGGGAGGDGGNGGAGFVTIEW